MSNERCKRGHAFTDLLDYWTGDTDRGQAEQIEERIFGCSECAEWLDEISATGHAIADVVRSGRFHSVLTESVLNRLSREGIRIRTYTLHPGATIPCAIWADDDLVVSRMRADFTGLDRADIALRLENGDEVSRVVDVPIAPGQRELLDGISAERLRQLPPGRLHLVVSGVRAGREAIVGQYTLEHDGAMSRDAR